MNGRAAITALGLIALASCRDMTDNTPRIDATMTPSAQLRARNKHDWVGVAHNKAIDDFRKELRKPGRIARNLCDYLTQKRDAAAAARVALETSPLCPTRAKHAAWMPQSSLATQLLSDIELAVDAASSADDLASRLNQVLDASAALSAGEQEAIAATVSVAQHSYEYWDANFSRSGKRSSASTARAPISTSTADTPRTRSASSA